MIDYALRRPFCYRVFLVSFRALPPASFAQSRDEDSGIEGLAWRSGRARDQRGPGRGCRPSLLEEPGRPFDKLFQATQEAGRHRSVYYLVVDSQAHGHHLANDNIAVFHDRLLHRPPHA